MSWRIGLVDNDLVVSKQCAKDLMKSVKYEGSWNPDYRGDTAWPTEEFDEGGYLYFDEDAMEHMDYLHSEKIQNILKKHKVTGKVRFASVDGDNSGTMWEHRFTNGEHKYVSVNLADVTM